MSLMNWTDEYSLGIQEIDIQHKKMFSLINDLNDAMHEGVLGEPLSGFLKRMVDYAEYHFQVEERYFEGFNFEGKEDHLNQHNAYRERVAQYVEEYEQGDGPLPFEILLFLENWWIGHVTHVDKLYVELFHAKGLR